MNGVSFALCMLIIPFSSRTAFGDVHMESLQIAQWLNGEAINNFEWLLYSKLLARMRFSAFRLAFTRI